MAGRAHGTHAVVVAELLLRVAICGVSAVAAHAGAGLRVGACQRARLRWTCVLCSVVSVTSSEDLSTSNTKMTAPPTCTLRGPPRRVCSFSPVAIGRGVTWLISASPHRPHSPPPGRAYLALERTWPLAVPEPGYSPSAGRAGVVGPRGSAEPLKQSMTVTDQSEGLLEIAQRHLRIADAAYRCLDVCRPFPFGDGPSRGFARPGRGLALRVIHQEIASLAWGVAVIDRPQRRTLNLAVNRF